jgi:hypothetical protein
MRLDIKGVNSVLLIIIIALVLYCLLRKELFTTSPAVPTTVCNNSNEKKTYHPNGNNKPELNPKKCMYVGGDKSSCNLGRAPLAANSGDDNLAGVLGYLVGKSDVNIEEMDKFDGSNMCKLCSNIPDAKTCLPTGMTCEHINTETKLAGKLNDLYGSYPDKQAKLDELAKKYERQIGIFENENNSMSDKYKYLVGACDSYCNMFNI